MSTIRGALSWVVLTLALGGCGRTPEPVPGPSRPEFTPTSVRIVDIAPAPSEPLRAGSSVTFALDIAYTLSTNEGTAGIVVQDAQDQPLAQRFDAVTGHAGRARLSLKLDVPDTETLRVFTPIAAQGQVGTTVVDVREYRVQAR